MMTQFRLTIGVFRILAFVLVVSLYGFPISADIDSSSPVKSLIDSGWSDLVDVERVADWDDYDGDPSVPSVAQASTAAGLQVLTAAPFSTALFPFSVSQPTARGPPIA